MRNDTVSRSRFGRTSAFAALAVASAAPAAAQTGGDRVGGWTVAKVAVSEGGSVCSALRLYGGGYGMEIIQARGLPRQLILRLESPRIKTGQIDDYSALFLTIGDFGEPRGDAALRKGPRGLAYVTVLKETGGNPAASDIRKLRSARSVSASIGSSETGTEIQHIGTYDLAGSGAALDALARCVNGQAATTPAAPMPTPNRAPARQAFPAPAAGRLPVPFGRYTANGNCTTADLILTPKYWGDDGVGDGWAIGPFRNLGGNRWALSPAVTITVTGPRSFTVKGRTMTWCGA